jgi:hypothetical protein
LALLLAFALCTWFSLTSSLLLAIALWIGGIAAASLVTVAAWRIRYRMEPVFATIAAVRTDLAAVTTELDEAKRGFEDLKAKRVVYCRRIASFHYWN